MKVLFGICCGPLNLVNIPDGIFGFGGEKNGLTILDREMKLVSLRMKVCWEFNRGNCRK